ncbi:MAG TPA: HAMP domain-containing sensor histidine kinase [Solirubrobacteraceae bacterium]|nr:HAMP domain-containing sensor histidine kinase [Solirubrobacteraceae bacterium]
MDQDSVGHRVPLSAVKLLTAALPVAWAGAVTVVAASDSLPAAVLTGSLLVVVALLATQAARLAAGRRSPGSLDRQVAIGVALPVAQMVLAAVLFAAIMFFSTHDAVLIVLVSAFAGTLGLLTGRMVTRRLVSDVRAVRDGLADVGEGRRNVEIEAHGSEELAELAAAANAMAQRLLAEERARSNLVAAISHDLRTPLTSLHLVAQALSDDILAAEERRKYLGRMQLHIAALSGLIEDLFELSRLEAGERAWAMESVKLSMLAGETLEAMQAEATAKRITVDCEIDDDLPSARANPERLQRVLFNLLHNAIRHTPAGGVITILAEVVNAALEIEVADTGTGIPEAERGHVFDAFRQGGDGAARGGNGAGLGLAIARAIVEAHDGRIWLAPACRGTRVRFRLPIASS